MLKIFIQLAMSLVLVGPVYGASVSRVKGKSVLIEDSFNETRKGQIYYGVVNSKKKAIIKIVNKRKGEALGRILKGVGIPGAQLMLRKTVVQNIKKTTTITRRNDLVAPTRASYKVNYALGILAGANYNLGAIEYTENTTGNRVEGSLTGINENIKAFIDLNLTPRFSLRARMGWMPYYAEAEDTAPRCLPDQVGAPSALFKCAVFIDYVGGDIAARLKLSVARAAQFWVGASVGIYHPINSEGTTALGNSVLETIMHFTAGAGVDIRLSERLFMPIEIDYELFPPSENVSLSSIGARMGFGLRL